MEQKHIALVALTPLEAQPTYTDRDLFSTPTTIIASPASLTTTLAKDGYPFLQVVSCPNLFPHTLSQSPTFQVQQLYLAPLIHLNPLYFHRVMPNCGQQLKSSSQLN